MFNQEFIIHPVGQGLFYSGLIHYNNEIKFRMVFDCGSKTSGAGQMEVDLYRDLDYLNRKTLDLLVISHFDEDHVKHIGRLLGEGIKVKRLVMPFITFTERLFLVARYLDENTGTDPVDDFVIDFILDPLGTMGDNLDGDSEVFLIENDPDNPIPINKEIPSEGEQSSDEQKRYFFDFENNSKEEVDSNFVETLKSNSKVYKIKDSNKGKLKSGGRHKLMEFLFYKRSIGALEEEFFKYVEEFFYEKYTIDKSLPIEKRLAETIEKVKTIGSATEIKKIFEKAKAKIILKPIKGIKIEDLNTTSLCMLHRNLVEIFDFLSYPSGRRDRAHFDFVHYFDAAEIIHIQKYISADPSRIETQNFYNRYYFWADKRFERPDRFIYPNVLLTSDSFLLSPDQTKEFLNHYKNYWDDFWLFQIPHHGSEKSSNGLLHSNIPVTSNNFINYGVGNKDSHPSMSVINDLVATGNSVKLISINQFSGLRFKLRL